MQSFIHSCSQIFDLVGEFHLVNNPPDYRPKRLRLVKKTVLLFGNENHINSYPTSGSRILYRLNRSPCLAVIIWNGICR